MLRVQVREHVFALLLTNNQFNLCGEEADQHASTSEKRQGDGSV